MAAKKKASKKKAPSTESTAETGNHGKVLMPIAGWNKVREEAQKNPKRGPIPNGLACPDCGHELVDSNPNQINQNRFNTKDVHCPALRDKEVTVKDKRGNEVKKVVQRPCGYRSARLV